MTACCSFARSSRERCASFWPPRAPARRGIVSALHFSFRCHSSDKRMGWTRARPRAPRPRYAMAKPKPQSTTKAKPKSAAAARGPMDPQRPRLMRRVLVHISAAILFVGGLAVGFYFMRQHVERDLVFPSAAPHVVLKNGPVWMSDFLAEQIVRSARPIGAHSSFDHQLLVDVTRKLES